MELKVWFFNIVLLLSHISAIWQAYLLAYLLIEDQGAEYNFQKDLGISDFQVAVVTGSVFTFTNGIANLIFGIIADRYPRKWIWISCCVMWSVCTFAESYC